MSNNEKNNPMNCDPVTGLCEIPGATASTETGAILQPINRQKPVKVLYFTDPICSSCWGVEAQLRKLKLEYGNYFEIEYRMGGLLKSWDTYGGRDVGKPTDVATHWEEASNHYQMPIDGDVWLEDPLSSSYPPSVAFKAAQLQGEEKAQAFLRRIKEMVFLEKKNITKWEHLKQAASQTGLDAANLKAGFEGPAIELFNQDLDLARQLGVRGFPTIFFTDANQNRFMVYGSKPYQAYEEALLKLKPDALKQIYNTSYESLFAQFPTLTTKEFAELSNLNFADAELALNELHRNKKIEKQESKKGPLWKKPGDK